MPDDKLQWDLRIVDVPAFEIPFCFPFREVGLELLCSQPIHSLQFKSLINGEATLDLALFLYDYGIHVVVG